RLRLLYRSSLAGDDAHANEMIEILCELEERQVISKKERQTIYRNLFEKKMMKYCFKCKRRTRNAGVPTLRVTKNNRLLGTTRCEECGSKKYYFTKNNKKEGKGILNKMIDTLPL